MFTKMTSPPPSAPCTARPAINIAIVFAKAQTRLPTRKITFAKSRTGFRPNTSLALAQKGVIAEYVRRYADPIHEYADCEALKLSAMYGRAVVTMVKSRAARNVAMPSARTLTVMDALLRAVAGSCLSVPTRPSLRGPGVPSTDERVVPGDSSTGDFDEAMINFDKLRCTKEHDKGPTLSLYEL